MYVPVINFPNVGMFHRVCSCSACPSIRFKFAYITFPFQLYSNRKSYTKTFFCYTDFQKEKSKNNLRNTSPVMVPLE